MKRLLSLAAMFLCCIATSFAQFSGSGSGTENDPYLILNPIHLNQLRNFLNTEGVYFKMMSDVDLTEFIDDEYGGQGWLPIGNSESAAFKGILDGNGKTISGLWINRSNSNYVGLFGYISNAIISDIKIAANNIVGTDFVAEVSGYSNRSTINNCEINGIVKGHSYVGGYVGGAYETIVTNCNSTTNVEGSGNGIGGFIGSNYFDWYKGKGKNAKFYTNGSLKSCRLSNEYVKGGTNVGGLCGEYGINEVISDCFVYSNVTGDTSVGGLFGEIHHSSYQTFLYSGNTTRYVFYFQTKIDNCGFIGNVIGDSNVGGLVGRYLKELKDASPYMDYENNPFSCNNSINKSFVVGNVKALNDYAGGITGYSIASISNCYYSGIVNGGKYVGGIAGYNYQSLNRSYSNATILGNQYVGGITGYSVGDVSTCSAVNRFISSQKGSIGRIVGQNEGTVGAMGTSDENKSYNRTIVISQSVAEDVIDDVQNGTGVSATTLKLKATYVAMGWDFTDTWAIQETECYPYFKTQTAPPVITSQVVSGATTISGKCVDGGTVTLEFDGAKQQMVSSGHEFSFTVSPLQAGHEVRICAKAEGKEQSYYTTETVAYLGSGKENDPYQVYTASDLTGVYRKGYFKLMNDIDLTDYINQFSPTEGWESIGREGSETIHFDGDGHKITGLWCNSTRDNTGLFSCFANGTIKNLMVETASGKHVKGGANTGILIGKMINGTIENCRVSGNVADGTPVGGIVGLLDGGKISLSQANVTINTTGNTSYIGGLVGEITSGDIDQCVTLGTLTAIGNESYVGGLVGKNSATVTNCYSNANVTSSYNAAGLIAYNYGLVDKCYATGDLFSNNYGAGVIGYNDGSSAVVKNCVAMNNKIDVTYESQSAQGGGYGQRIIGGIKNGAPAPELNNYALKMMHVSVNDLPQKVYDDIMNGVGKTVADLMKQTTYQTLGWEFTEIWSIVEDESYPSLSNIGSIVVNPDDPDDPDPIIVDENNKLTIDNITGYRGGATCIPVNMVNDKGIAALQFDVSLPSGLTMKSATLTSRKVSGHGISTNVVNGNIRIMVSSSNISAFSGSEGPVVNLHISVDKNISTGTKNIIIKNIRLSTTESTKIKVSDIKVPFTISNLYSGDSDGDGEIDVNDVTTTISTILNRVVSSFIFGAADVDGDGMIDVNDVQGTIDRALGKTGGARMMDNSPSKAEMHEPQ